MAVQVVDHSLQTRRKRRQRRDAVPETAPARPRLEALAEASRMLDLEFAFGGPEDDTVIPVLEFEELPERSDEPEPVPAGDEQSAGIARLNAALGRFKRRR
jgi:hypothetical protein